MLEYEVVIEKTLKIKTDGVYCDKKCPQLKEDYDRPGCVFISCKAFENKPDIYLKDIMVPSEPIFERHKIFRCKECLELVP